ncbi:MAG: hypothetical protein AAF560_18415 [Acidobacteriota bacterium]
MNMLRSVRFALGALVASVGAAPLMAQFVEPDVATIRLLSGDQTGDYFGWLVANVGDVDGDTVDDHLIPAIAFNGFAGRITLFSGADGTVLNDVVGSPGTAFGYGVAAAGDVDGDGVPDYIAGGGQVLVFSGADHRVIHDLSAIGGFIDSVDGAGDLNGDGYGDLVLGEQAASVSAPQAGRAYAVSGADGSVLWTRDGTASGDLLGSAIGGVGDVDYDQVPDIVVGASGAGPFDGGEALVLSGRDGAVIRTLRPFSEESAMEFGSFFASGAGDVDGDGVGDIYVGDFNEGLGDRAASGAVHVFSGRNGRLLHLLKGLEPGEGFGLGRGIPDVNGDGCADLLIGAFTNSRGAPGAGATYLFSGRSGALLRTFSATLAGDSFGGDASHAGDVDADGLTDFVVTAPGLSIAGLDRGRAYVLGGSVLPCPADLNGDGWVGLRDFWRLRRAFGDTDSDADLNGDAQVDIKDLVVLFRDLGRCSAGFPH